MTLRPALLAITAAVLVSLPAGGALAFSQITTEEGETRSREGIISVPLPPVPGAGPGASAPPPRDPEPSPSAPDAVPAAGPSELPGGASMPDGAAPQPDLGPDPLMDRTDADPDSLPIPIRYGDEGLDGPVRDLRSRLIEIARAGDIEALRPYLETGEKATVVSAGDAVDDPIGFLKTVSGDGEGVELLAILLEVLQGGHVHLDAGEDTEIFVWPYFTQVAMDRLTKPQLVELFELVTAGDYGRMFANGHYDFYRVGISPAGRLEFFVAGD